MRVTMPGRRGFSQPSSRNACLVRFESADVARYYDQNTASFLAHGQGGAQGIVHRAVWGEGVGGREEAFHFVHDLLRARIAESGARRILDLGCGVGASLEHVLRGTEVAGFGVTNSAVHAELARKRLGGRATIFELDFCSDPLPAPVDLAFGIESFVQATDAEAFLANIAKAVAANGYLVLCDDFLTGAGEDRWVSEFRRGWRASSLLHPLPGLHDECRRGGHRSERIRIGHAEGIGLGGSSPCSRSLDAASTTARILPAGRLT